MPKLTRKYQKIFAGSASNNGQFGSAQLGTKVLSNDLDTIQALSAFLNGWNDATISSEKLPPLEEFQALHYITTRQLSYLFEQGIPEYDVSTTYFQKSMVIAPGTYELWGSLVNDNVGNSLVEGANWTKLVDLSTITSYTPTPANALSGSVIQVVNYQTGAYASGSTTMPNDNTIPQNTEGNEFMTLAITPNHADNLLKIDICALVGEVSNTGDIITGALFKDSIADALMASQTPVTTGGSPMSVEKSTINFSYFMPAGTTSEITFKFRAGNNAGSVGFNGSDAQYLGGVAPSSITITEIKA